MQQDNDTRWMFYMTESQAKYDELSRQHHVLEEEHNQITKYYATHYRSQEIRPTVWKRKFLFEPTDSSYMADFEWVFKVWMKEWDTWKAWILDIRSGLEDKMDNLGVGNTKDG